MYTRARQWPRLLPNRLKKEDHHKKKMKELHLLFFHGIVVRGRRAFRVQRTPSDRYMMFWVLLIHKMLETCLLEHTMKQLDDRLEHLERRAATCNEHFHDLMGIKRSLLMKGDCTCCGKSHFHLKTFVHSKCHQCRRRGPMIACMSCFTGLCASCSNATPYQWQTSEPEGPFYSQYKCPSCRTPIRNDMLCHMKSRCPICMRRVSKTFVSFGCGHGMCGDCRDKVQDA